MASKELIVVIGRQYGSGGHEIGKALAQRLALPFFDKKLIAEAASECGYRKEIFLRDDERKPSLLQSILALCYGSPSPYSRADNCSGQEVYELMSDTIKSIVDNRGSCVIVGRTADYVLRNHPGLASVFLHAGDEHRIRRIIARGDASDPDEARQLMARRDKLRRDYYNYYTGRSWGTAANYHFSLCTDDLAPDTCAAIIHEYIKARR